MEFTYCPYNIPDVELLETYGIQNLSTFDHLFSHVVLLTAVLNKRECFFSETSISKRFELEPEEDRLHMKVRYALSRRRNIYDAYTSVRDYVKLFPDYEYYKALCSKLLSMPYDELEQEYPHLLVAMIQQQDDFKKTKRHGVKTAELISAILNEKGCDKVRLDIRRHPFLAPEATSVGFVQCWDAALYYIICEIYGIRNNLRDRRLLENKKECNAVIIEQGEFTPRTPQKFLKVIENQISPEVKYVLYVLNDVNRDKELLEFFMAKGVLAEVVARCSFRSESVVVLDMAGGRSGVRFRKLYADGIRDERNMSEEIPYDLIKSFDYSLNYVHYTTPECHEGQSIVKLGDICEVGKDCNSERFYIRGKIPQYYAARDFKAVVYNSEHPGIYEEPYASIYKGPHLHVTSKAEFLLSKSDGYYFGPSTWNYALRTKDNNISLEYLAYELGRDATFMNFISQNPTVENLLARKVALIMDKDKQDEIVSSLLDLNDQVVNSPARYHVAFVDQDVVNMFDSPFDNLMSQDTDDLSEDEADAYIEQLFAEMTNQSLDDKLYSWQIEASKYDRITGESGFLKALESKDFKVDAIVVDPLTDSIRDRYKGLRELLAKLRGSKIPVYLYTDVDQILLEDDLDADDYNYFANGRLFKKLECDSIRALIASLRTELDKSGNSLSKLQGDYTRVFEAAKWLDTKFPKLSVVSTLSYCLLQPNTSLNTARGLVNGLYQAMMREISNGSGLETMDEGMFPSLMQRGSYVHNNQILYTVVGKVMPLPLAYSLRYASDIMNGASHQEDVEKMDIKGYLEQMKSDNIANAVLRILMEFLLWLYEVKFEFAGYCISEDVKLVQTVNWKGILKQASEKEFYCETTYGESVRVYVNFQKSSKNGPERVGSEITIKRVSIETQMRDKYKWKADKFDWE